MDNIKNKVMEDNENKVVEKKLNLDDLSGVSGGSGLRHTKKERTYDISEDTKNKMMGK